MVEALSMLGIIFFVVMFFASIWLNIYLFRKLLYFNENFYMVSSSLDNFTKHLDQIYELPTFYGDETLQGLVEHSRDLRDDLIQFQQKYSEE